MVIASGQVISAVVIGTYSSSPGNSWNLKDYSSLCGKTVKNRAKKSDKDTKSKARFFSAGNEFATVLSYESELILHKGTGTALL